MPDLQIARLLNGAVAIVVASALLLIAGCGGGGGNSSSPETSPPSSTPTSTTSLDALRQFGFGQAVVSPADSDSRARDDVAVVIGYLADRSSANNFRSLAVGNAANVAYVIVPNTIQTSQLARAGALGAAQYNTWLGSSNQIGSLDVGAMYPNDRVFSFLRLDVQGTRSTMSTLLDAMLRGTNGLNGFYIDLLDSSVAYTAQLTALLRDFKKAEGDAGRKEPVIATNLASLRAYLTTRYFDSTSSDTSTLPATFDLVMTEEYGNPRFAWPDKSPAHVVNFHERYPSILIIANVRYKMNNIGTGYQTDNPGALPDTPCAPPFSAIDADHLRVREAVTVAELVGGFHAVDDGTQCHGKNTYAKAYLDFPNRPVGKPISPIQDTAQFYRRDYARMIAVYAKAAATIPLPSGEWADYWVNQGTGPILTNSISVSAGTSYLLFKR